MKSNNEIIVNNEWWKWWNNKMKIEMKIENEIMKIIIMKKWKW